MGHKMELMDAPFWTAISILAFSILAALVISALVCRCVPDRD